VLSHWPFVSRSTIVGEAGALAGSAAGKVVVIVGPAGVGRTRLLGAIQRALVSVVPTLRVATFDGTGLDGFEIAAAFDRQGDDRALGSGAVLVDDAHLMDASSAGRLATGVAQKRCSAVVTLPAGRELPAELAGLVTEELHLVPLAAEDVRDLLQGVLGGPVFTGTVARLQEETEGNLWFLRELVGESVRRGVLAPDPLGCWRLTGPPALPRRLRGVIAEPYLASEMGEALTTIACGEPVPEAVAELLLGGDRHVLRAHTCPTAGGVRLRDRATAAALVAGANPLRRRRALRVLLAATDGLVGGEVSDVLATDRRTAWRVGLGICDGAALSAVHRIAAAGGTFEAARNAGCVAANAPTDAVKCEAALAAARYLAASGDPVGAQLQLVTARKATRAQELRAEIDARRDAINFWNFGRIPAERDMEQTPGVPNPIGDILRAILALLDRGVGPGIRAARPLYAAGGQCRPGAAFVLALALAVAGRYRSAGRLADRVIVEETDWYEFFLWDGGLDPLRFAHALGAAYAGDATGTERFHARADDGDADMHDHGWTSFVAGTFDLAVGDDSDALTHFLDASAAFELAGQGIRHRWSVAGVLSAAARVDLDQARRAATLLESLPPSPVGLFSAEELRASGRHAMAVGDRPSAIRNLRNAAERARAYGASALELAALADLASVGASPPDLERVVAVAGKCQGVMAGLHATMAQALLDGTAADLESVASRYRSAGIDQWANVALEHAAVRFRRGGRKDMAARALADRSSGVPAAADLDMTTREADLARLVGSGLTNRQIAERLGLSPRTVDNMLHRLYVRLGLEGRRGLTRLMEGR